MPRLDALMRTPGKTRSPIPTEGSLNLCAIQRGGQTSGRPLSTELPLAQAVETGFLSLERDEASGHLAPLTTPPLDLSAARNPAPHTSLRDAGIAYPRPSERGRIGREGGENARDAA